MKSWRLLLFFSITLFSCSSPPYRPEVPLSDIFFESIDGAFRGQVPEGWFAPPESDLPPHLAAWLIREDYSAMLVFQEIKVDQKTSRMIEEEGLTFLAEVSFQLKQADERSATLIEEPREVLLDGKLCAWYEYRSGPQEQKSVVVFRAMNRYFESTVVQTKPSNPTSYEQLAKTQRSVVFSIR